MKYTRYDLKNKKNNLVFFLSVISIVLVLALVFGTIISKLFIKGNNDNAVIKNVSKENTLKKDSTKQDVAKQNVVKQDVANKDSKKTENKSYKSNRALESDITNYTIIQCGVFSKKENAEILKKQIKKFGEAFVVNEDNKFKTILGVYNKEETEKIVKIFENSKKEYVKTNIVITPKDKCDIQICELLDASMQVVHKLSQEDVKGVKTKELKTWTENLENIDKSSTNYSLLVSIKNNINNFPETLSKENVIKEKSFIYNTLKKMDKK